MHRSIIERVFTIMCILAPAASLAQTHSSEPAQAPTTSQRWCVNTDQPDDWIHIPYLSARQARFIAAHRAHHGPIHSLDELKQVRGISKTLLKHAARHAVFDCKESVS